MKARFILGINIIGTHFKCVERTVFVMLLTDRQKKRICEFEIPWVC